MTIKYRIFYRFAHQNGALSRANTRGFAGRWPVYSGDHQRSQISRGTLTRESLGANSYIPAYVRIRSPSDEALSAFASPPLDVLQIGGCPTVDSFSLALSQISGVSHAPCILYISFVSSLSPLFLHRWLRGEVVHSTTLPGATALLRLRYHIPSNALPAFTCAHVHRHLYPRFDKLFHIYLNIVIFCTRINCAMCYPEYKG